MTTPSIPAHETVGQRNWNLNVQLPEDHYDAVVRDALGGFAELEVRTGRLNVLLCAQPKSASLYTTQLLASTLDLVNHQVGFARSGGGLYYPRLLLAKYVDGDTISHCHESPSGELLRLARQLDLRLVVLVRGLLDALVSRRDMLARGLGRSVDPERVRSVSARIGAEGGINLSTGRVGRGIEELDETQLARVEALARRYGVVEPALLGFVPA